MKPIVKVIANKTKNVLGFNDHQFFDESNPDYPLPYHSFTDTILESVSDSLSTALKWVETQRSPLNSVQDELDKNSKQFLNQLDNSSKKLTKSLDELPNFGTALPLVPFNATKKLHQRWLEVAIEKSSDKGPAALVETMAKLGIQMRETAAETVLSRPQRTQGREL